MTDKELRKLRRQDLLQLLLAQGKETAALQESLEEKKREYDELLAGNERLKDKLNEKDALIEKLKMRLDDKDAKIHGLRTEMEKWRTNRRIELQEAGSIAMAALKLNGVFDAAQRAADQYLFNIRQMYGVQADGNRWTSDSDDIEEIT